MLVHQPRVHPQGANVPPPELQAGSGAGGQRWSGMGALGRRWVGSGAGGCSPGVWAGGDGHHSGTMGGHR